MFFFFFFSNFLFQNSQQFEAIPQTIDTNFGKPQEYITMVNQQSENDTSHINLDENIFGGDKRKRGTEQEDDIEEKLIESKKIKIQEVVEVEDEEDEEDEFIQVDGMITEDIEQLDGGKNEDELDSNDDENDNEDELNSEDDEQIPQTNDIILAQFEKVTRTKNKWKASLKCGICSFNGKDYIFNKATGEFDW